MYTNSSGIMVKKKGTITTNIGTSRDTGQPIYESNGGGTPAGQPGGGGEEGGIITYDCIGGTCLRVPGGEGQYATLEACQRYCVEVSPPETGIDLEPVSDDDREVEGDDRSVPTPIGGICGKGTYWCEELGSCIPEKTPCIGKTPPTKSSKYYTK